MTYGVGGLDRQEDPIGSLGVSGQIVPVTLDDSKNPSGKWFKKVSPDQCSKWSANGSTLG